MGPTLPPDARRVLARLELVLEAALREFILEAAAAIEHVADALDDVASRQALYASTALFRIEHRVRASDAVSGLWQLPAEELDALRDIPKVSANPESTRVVDVLVSAAMRVFDGIEFPSIVHDTLFTLKSERLPEVVIQAVREWQSNPEARPTIEMPTARDKPKSVAPTSTQDAGSVTSSRTARDLDLPLATPTPRATASRPLDLSVAEGGGATIPEGGHTRDARKTFFRSLRTRMISQSATATQLGVLDLVAGMFDYALDDERTPAAVMALFWRLQEPVLSLCLLDASYLADEPRSLRRLVENLSAMSQAYVAPGQDFSELQRRLETVVRAVEIVATALSTRTRVLADQVRRELDRAASSVEQLADRVRRDRLALEHSPERRNRRDVRRRPDAERERRVTEKVQDIVTARLKDRDVPESVRDFLFSVWTRHLRTAALRDGEDSREFQLALQVIDDLLWSLNAGHRRQRGLLAQRIPPLIGLLTQGLHEVGASDEDFKPFFDELFLIHLRRMHRREKAREEATSIDSRLLEPTPTEARPTPPPVRPVPTAPESPAADPVDAPESRATTLPLLTQTTRATQTARPESSLNALLASLDLSDLPDIGEDGDADPQQAMDTLQRGDWLRLIGTDGDIVSAKVAWINARRSVVLLLRHPDRRALSMRAEELLDRMRRGRARRVARARVN